MPLEVRKASLYSLRRKQAHQKLREALQSAYYGFLASLIFGLGRQKMSSQFAASAELLLESLPRNHLKKVGAYFASGLEL